MGTLRSDTFFTASRADPIASASDGDTVSSKFILVTGTSALAGGESTAKMAPPQPAWSRIADSSSVISRLRTSENLCPIACHLSMSDRKSTRLNSSHLGISYAVFCLKKNKKKYQKAFPARISSSVGPRHLSRRPH